MQIIMMEKYRKFKNQRTDIYSELNEEQFELLYGCCLFHDDKELTEFNDIDDDNDDSVD